jgi:hypothetical protein
LDTNATGGMRREKNLSGCMSVFIGSRKRRDVGAMKALIDGGFLASCGNSVIIPVEYIQHLVF